jgi:AcrR family transcriptional regulator
VERPATPVEPPKAADRSMRADARRNRERLIEVGREAFARYGADAPMDDIARQAGVGAGTLYRHFPTREALLLAVYCSDIETISERARVLGTELPPWEALDAWLREQLDYVSHRQGVGAAIKKMLVSETETLDYCRDAMRSAAGGLLTRAQSAGLVRADVEPVTLLRLVHAVGVASETAPEQAEPMLRVVLAGLRTEVSTVDGGVTGKPERRHR